MEPRSCPEHSAVLGGNVGERDRRSGLLCEDLGSIPVVGFFFGTGVNPVEEVVEAALRLAKNKVGALIAFERESGLGAYVEGGVKLDAEVSSELIETVFFPGSALHDGAVIVQEKRIAAAGCLFPLTDNPTISKQLGTRHRAAIGVTEETDAVTLCVSEETGKVSLGVGGELHRNLDADSLSKLLHSLVVTEEGVRK
ncbi:diadenylate cyclase [Planctomycetota bacterium]